MGVQIKVGHLSKAGEPKTLRALAAEFVSTLLFVFAGVGSVSAFDKLQEGELTPSGLIAVALAHAFALFVAVSIAANASGGHVNPAVTFGLLFGGHVTIVETVLYWIVQLLGSSVACYLLKIITKMDTPVHALGSGVSSKDGLVCEIVITFSLIYTVYATAVDPKKAKVGILAPLAIGLVVGANILGAGPFSGGSMNPARAFGPALISGNWLNQWVYWVGPLLGAALAGIAYSAIFISDTDPNPGTDGSSNNNNDNNGVVGCDGTCFGGGSMNLTCAFGPTLVIDNWLNMLLPFSMVYLPSSPTILPPYVANMRLLTPLFPLKMAPLYLP